MRPVGQEGGEIEERIAARALVPVEDRGGHGRRAFGEHDVVELVVVVQKRDVAVGNALSGEPVSDLARRFGRQLVVEDIGAGDRAAFVPAGDGALEEPFGPSQPVEPDSRRIDRMQGAEHIDEELRERRLVTGQIIGEHGADDPAGAVLHDEERLAEDRLVTAEMQRPRSQRELAPQTREHPVFAPHVVGPGGQRSRRRTAQHHRLAVHGQEVVEVAEAAGELPGRGRGLEGKTLSFQMRGELVPVLRLAGLGDQEPLGVDRRR